MRNIKDSFVAGYTFRGFSIPQYILEALNLYIEKGTIPGDFLKAVICNDLFKAVGKADEHNILNLQAYVAYLYNEAPSDCWGSEEKMRSWVSLKQNNMGVNYEN